MAEGFQNFRGGVDTAPTVIASTLDVHLGVDTSKAFDWPGGELYADLRDHAGRNPSSLLVGDLEIFDKLNYTPFLQAAELWYQQKLFKGRLRIKIGKVDANDEFSVIDNGLPFLSSSTQVSPTIFVFPTIPTRCPVSMFFSCRMNLFMPASAPITPTPPITFWTSLAIRMRSSAARAVHSSSARPERSGVTRRG
ncbi:MAG: carbohydrate porin [Candidatus Binataceae bacterium]